MTAERKELIAEVAATILLAPAAVATVWSGYQASQWHGIRPSPTSTAPTATSWRSCSSRRQSRWRASAPGCGCSRIRVAVLAVGWAVFLGTVAWNATFPVSL